MSGSVLTVLLRSIPSVGHLSGEDAPSNASASLESILMLTAQVQKAIVLFAWRLGRKMRCAERKAVDYAALLIAVCSWSTAIQNQAAPQLGPELLADHFFLLPPAKKAHSYRSRSIPATSGPSATAQAMLLAATAFAFPSTKVV